MPRIVLPDLLCSVTLERSLSGSCPLPTRTSSPSPSSCSSIVRPSGLFGNAGPHASRNTMARRRNLPSVGHGLGVIAVHVLAAAAAKRQYLTQSPWQGTTPLVIAGLNLVDGLHRPDLAGPRRNSLPSGGYTSGCSPRTTCTREAAKLCFTVCGRPVFSSRARICTVAIFWWCARGRPA